MQFEQRPGLLTQFSIYERHYLKKRVVTLSCLFKGKSSAWLQGVKGRLKAGRSYGNLKTNFKIRVSEESQCADHCQVFALSDPEDHLCEHEHTKSCQSCDNIKNVLDEIELVLSSRDLHFR